MVVLKVRKTWAKIVVMWETVPRATRALCTLTPLRDHAKRKCNETRCDVEYLYRMA
jgi:hypothetical protein